MPSNICRTLQEILEELKKLNTNTAALNATNTAMTTQITRIADALNPAIVGIEIVPDAPTAH